VCPELLFTNGLSFGAGLLWLCTGFFGAIV